MDTNEGMFDRTLRVLLGLALIASPLGVYGLENANAWGWIGVVPLAIGGFGNFVQRARQSASRQVSKTTHFNSRLDQSSHRFAHWC